MTAADKKRLVILGGGLSGLPLALHIEKHKKLSQAFHVTLVDKKEYFELNIASVRFLVDSSQFNSYVAPYANYLKSTKFVRGEVRTVQVQPQQVEVATAAGSEVIPYDYLVIAVGTRYPYFKAEAHTIQARSGEVAAFAQQLQAARRILVAGGRSVGVEVAGEILSFLPDKEVTIVHPGDSLMDMWPKSAMAKLRKFMEANKVTVVLKQKVVRSEGIRHELSDGSIIEADVKIFATGITPNSEPLRQYLSTALTEAGYLKVQKTMQVEGHTNVFAMGDIADLNLPKMAANNKAQVVLILKNLEASIQGKALSTKLSGLLMPFPALVTLGPKNGIMALAQFGGTSFSGKFLSNMKTDLFSKFIKNPAV